MSKLPIFDFWGLALVLMRRILYLGTRTQVFPETPEELGLRPDLPVCYVLDERHLSNLLVLDHECGELGLPRALQAPFTIAVPASLDAFSKGSLAGACRPAS